MTEPFPYLLHRYAVRRMDEQTKSRMTVSIRFRDLVLPPLIKQPSIDTNAFLCLVDAEDAAWYHRNMNRVSCPRTHHGMNDFSCRWCAQKRSRP